jgi:hypothetical protein
MTILLRIGWACLAFLSADQAGAHSKVSASALQASRVRLNGKNFMCSPWGNKLLTV